MAENPTTGELYRAKAIPEADLVAAVDTFMADPTTSAFLLGDGYRLNLAKAVQAHAWALIAVADQHASEHAQRLAVHTAILLGRPEKR